MLPERRAKVLQEARSDGSTGACDIRAGAERKNGREPVGWGLPLPDGARVEPEGIGLRRRVAAGQFEMHEGVVARGVGVERLCVDVVFTGEIP